MKAFDIQAFYISYTLKQTELLLSNIKFIQIIQHYFWKIKKDFTLSVFSTDPMNFYDGLMANVVDSDIIVRLFELQSHY